MKISDIPYDELVKYFSTTRKGTFTSDCEFFPNFKVSGTVYNIYKRPNSQETMFKVKEQNKGKFIEIGSNMRNLVFQEI